MTTKRIMSSLGKQILDVDVSELKDGKIRIDLHKNSKDKDYFNAKDIIALCKFINNKLFEE
jgi:hypothetical protein